MKADAVFEGGGMRGIGIVGALSYCESTGLEWQRMAGTSAGAIIATLLTAGYTAKDLKKLIIETNFTRFLDKDAIQKVPVIGKALGFFKEKGLYSGDYFESWLNELLSAKGIYTFKDVYNNGESRLKIIASDITRRKKLVLPDDLSEYGINPMDFPISLAVRMSISIPFYFKPVELNYLNGVSYIVDGGVCCNFPITIFDIDGIPRWPTIGFKFENENVSNTACGKTDALSFLFDIANTMTGNNMTEWTRPENTARTIFIPTVGVASIDFNISKEKSLKLFKSGYHSAQEFLKGWNFEDYIRMHRVDYNTETILA